MKITNLVEALQKYNIRAREYSRPPAGQDVFAITIKRGHPESTVVVHQGKAQIEINGSRKLRQAVVTVKEKGREVTHKVTTNIMVSDKPASDKGERVPGNKPTTKEVEKRLIDRFPLVMPEGTQWTVTDTTCVKREDSGYTHRTQWDITGLVTAKVKKSTVNHFLVGIDETDLFISSLKRHVSSVQEAHKILRPPEVTKDLIDRKRAPRQGEWFFVRCARKVANMLNKLATEQPSKLKTYRLGDTTHTAKTAVVVDKKVYARGYIIDRRRGHHRSRWLDWWHLVLKNQETEFKVSPEQQAAAARRRRTFD